MKPPLTKAQIDEGIRECKTLPDYQITKVLDQFEKKQKQIYRAIYKECSDSIAELNQDMSNLFLDLCFDIIWLYRKYYGQGRKVSSKELENLLVEVDLELKSYDPQSQIEEKFRQRLLQHSFSRFSQYELMFYLKDEVEKYAAFRSSRAIAKVHTNNMLFLIITLMDKVYDINS
jgi:hypothetical protein